MGHDTLFSIGVIAVSGICAQWLAWQIRCPSIVLLLICGFLVGPVFGLVSPDLLQSELLYAIVSVSVSIILFEGSLRLKVSELRECGVAIIRLLTAGALVTWVLCSLGAYYLLHFSLDISVLFGAIFIVTGPTVVQPLLKHIRPSGRIAAILKWEGIAIDTVGALAAVMVYEFILADGFRKAVALVGVGILKTIFIGTAVGVLGAVILVLVIRHNWIPDFLHNAFALMIVVGSFVLMGTFYNEPTGFLSVTVMGIILANQNIISIKNILKFKEDLRTLLLPSLFIVLAARIPIGDLNIIDLNAWLFLAFLVFVVRPTAVFVATYKTDMKVQEKIFVSAIAPRGVVAAAVSSIFAAKLLAGGYQQADRLVMLAFFVIVGTVFIYGFMSPLLAKALKLTHQGQGVLILGAHAWARKIAQALTHAGVDVVMVDSNLENIFLGKKQGLTMVHGNFLNDATFEDIDFGRIGTVLALTPNNEANTLALLHLSYEFENKDLYQLFKKGAKLKGKEKEVFHGTYLFEKDADYDVIEAWFSLPAQVKTVDIKDLNTAYKFFQPLFVLDKQKKTVAPVTAGQSKTLKPNQSYLALIVK